MREAVIQYGLFLAETLTLLLVIAGAVALITRLARRGRRRPWLEVKNVNRRYDDVTRAVRAQILPGPQVKLERKADRRRARAQAREQRRQAKHPQTTAAQPDGASAPPQRLRLFVLDFQGDVHASQVAALREEITAVLMIATPQDEVVLRLENPGGLVHDQGLAASQLQRLTDRGVPLTVAVDKVAASGGYLMACVATKILAAPFAIVGSIGVISQTPNFHRLLDRHGIDYEQFKGGEPSGRSPFSAAPRRRTGRDAPRRSKTSTSCSSSSWRRTGRGWTWRRSRPGSTGTAPARWSWASSTS